MSESSPPEPSLATKVLVILIFCLLFAALLYFDKPNTCKMTNQDSDLQWLPIVW